MLCAQLLIVQAFGGALVYVYTAGAEDVGDHIEVEPAAIARLVPHDVGKKGGSWFGW